MPFFSSHKERRLWSWTLAVVVAIYSTLGLAGALAAWLGGTWVQVGLFLAGCLLVLATVLTEGLSRRPSGSEIVVALGLAAAYLMVFVRMGSPIERSHLVEYGVVAVFILAALRERASQGRKVPVPALLAILATSALGLIDECLQWFIPVRVFDPVDILFNVLAAVMAVTASVALRWARRGVTGWRRSPR
jgi:hypothetical protein